MRILSFYIILLFISVEVFAQSPHGKSIGTRDCASCHLSTTWKVDKSKIHFSHDETNFKLSGQHSQVDCISCHVGLDFSVTKTDCFSCHKDVHQTTVGTDCQRCHTTNTWVVKNIQQIHQLSRFTLVGVHRTVDCTRCHPGYNNLNFQPIGATCYSCHTIDYNNAKAPDHAANHYSIDCESCHNMTSIAWNTPNFQHDFFPLTGGHKIDNCFSCHKQNTFAGLSITCVSCHLTTYNNTTNPNHAALKLSTDCQSCHTITSFLQTTFNHNITSFVLTGAHVSLNCGDCHKSGTTGLGTTCVSCHQTNYNSAINHFAQSYPTDCTMCHSTINWTQSTFNHQTSAFPLTGAHTTIQCASCHTSGFGAIPTTCVSCHQTQFNSAPNHVAQSYPTDCTLCHSTTNWTQSTFNHQTSSFSLTGAHTTVQCTSCHTSGFGPIPITCVSCHLANFNGTTNPSHTALQLSTTCETCHNTNPGWTGATFPIHNNYFVLAGFHTSLTCDQCHKGTYNATSLGTTCISCHQTDYNNTNNPPHATTGFGTDCQTCHTQTAWQPATFNHDQQFFPISSGNHNVPCATCHIQSTDYTIFSCMTSGCHPKSSTDNQHSGIQGYAYVAAQCYACHPRGSSGGFNHATSIFPLTGAHVTVSCTQCHKNGYPNTPTTCISCHQTDYNNTNNPSHKTLALSTDCSTCHTTAAGWTGALFPIHGTYFQLTGAHVTTATCASCHNGNYSSAPTTCAGCHQAAYNTATNPNHSVAGLPSDCSTCHNSTAWIPSTFSHTNTGFTLTGTHLTIQCSSCHVGIVTGSSPLCYSCHKSGFTTAANHVSQSYPTTCEMCHSTTNWTQSTFNHQTSAFPLTGAHTTVQCASCHTSGFGAIPTTCVSCHQANYNSTTNPGHSTLKLSTSCESCHTTNTGWAPATFSIHSTYFVLAGFHTSLTCEQCHSGTYNGTSPGSTCISCHQTDYNNTTNPNHKTAQFPTDCTNCHSQTAWSPSTFNHDAQYFPIYSGSHNNRWTLCSQCHQTATDFSQFTCMSSGCHPQSQTNSQHSGRSGYSYTAAACYNCHPRGSGGIPGHLNPKHKILN